LGWNPAIIEKYLQNINNYNNVEGIFQYFNIYNNELEFTKQELRQQANRVSGFTDLWDFISPLLSLTESSGENSWISYAQIRKAYEGNPSKKLDDAINAHLLIKENNLYRFRNATLYNALLTNKKSN